MQQRRPWPLLVAVGGGMTIIAAIGLFLYHADRDCERNIRALKPSTISDCWSRRAARHLKSQWPAVAERVRLAVQSDLKWQVRAGAAELLGQMEDQSARDALLSGAKDQDGLVRKACWIALGKLGPDARTIEVLIAVFSDNDPFNRELASEILGDFGVVAAPRLVEVIQSKESTSEDKWWALGALARMGVAGAQYDIVLAEIIRHDRSERERVAFMCSFALASQWPESRDVLSKMLGDDEPRVRFWAAGAVGEARCNVAERRALLEPLASDEDDETKVLALRILERLGRDTDNGAARSDGTDPESESPERKPPSCEDR